MRYAATAVLAGALLFGGAPTAAQTFGFGAHAGVSIPTGSYSDPADLGFTGGLDLTLPLVAIAPSLSWYTSVDATAHSTSLPEADGGYLFFPIMTGLQLDLGGMGAIRPFVNGQLGVVVARGPNFDGQSTETGTEFGFALGGGLHLTQNLYAGVKWFNLGTVDFGYEPGPDLSHSVSFLDVYLGFGVR
jgi:opacity protein-like surface antigen